MSSVLYIDDNPENLIEFKRAFGHSGVEVDLACGFLTGLVRLNDKKIYDFVFVDENLTFHKMTGDLWGAEYLEQRARILNPSVVIVEFISGPQYNRRVFLDRMLMKPMHYRSREICDILEGTVKKENARAD
ncbi:hypothetical protein J4443_01665 [Candidatus Woesearchaeota archaeon]|nr:hypothetical protein [Candidatus Woesearchaeota archaeon]